MNNQVKYFICEVCGKELEGHRAIGFERYRVKPCTACIDAIIESRSQKDIDALVEKSFGELVDFRVDEILREKQEFSDMMTALASKQ